MAGLGWQELIIVVAMVVIWLGIAAAVYAAIQFMRARQHSASPYAGFWDRVSGAYLDFLVLFLPQRFASAVAGLWLVHHYLPFATLVTPGLVWLTYVVIGNGRGATLGKRWSHLRVVDATGAVPGLRRALVRAALPFGISLLCLVPLVMLERGKAAGASGRPIEAILLLGGILLLGAVDDLWMLRDPRKQTLHDKLAGTFVVRERPHEAPAGGALMPEGVS